MNGRVGCGRKCRQAPRIGATCSAGAAISLSRIEAYDLVRSNVRNKVLPQLAHGNALLVRGPG